MCIVQVPKGKTKLLASGRYLLNQSFTGGLFHCYLLDTRFAILGVSGLFHHLYSVFDGKSCKQTV